MLKKFKCGYCKDGVWRTRKGMREHLKEKHLRSDFFNTTNANGGVIRRKQIIEEDFI